MTTRAELLAPVTRWTLEKKINLLLAIQAGKITAQEATSAHALSTEELAAWWRAYQAQGATGLTAKALRGRRAA